MLDILGHHYGVQESLQNDPLKLDYAFFPDEETLDRLIPRIKALKTSTRNRAVGDAKAWNVMLDKSRQGKARREMTNPSYQIVYLRATPAKWARSSMPRRWRDPRIQVPNYLAAFTTHIKTTISGNCFHIFWCESGFMIAFYDIIER